MFAKPNENWSMQQNSRRKTSFNIIATKTEQLTTRNTKRKYTTTIISLAVYSLIAFPVTRFLIE